MNESGQRVRAKVGDVVAIHAHHLGEPERLGEILEILGSADHVHFRVRWDDDHESLSSIPAATRSSAFTDKSER